MLKKAVNLVLVIIFIIVVATPLATLLRQQPTVAAVIRTWSMTPLLTRGDLVFIWPTGENSNFSTGQIVVFQSEEHGIREWTMHRIVDGDAESGFITRGDANERTDQDGHYPPVKPEWIAGVVPTIGTLPLKLPLLGHIALYMEKQMTNQIMIPILVGILAAALVLDELFKTKKRRRKESLNQPQLYFLGGMAVAVMMGALMLMSSLFITFPYGVEKTPGVLMGSDVGILELGESRVIELCELSNDGFIPSFYCIVSTDPQVVPAESGFRLRQGDSATVKATVFAREEGLHQASVIVAMFMPFLPPGVTALLVRINYWLGLVAVSLVPALPVFVIPYLEPRYRRRFTKTWRRRLERTLVFFKL